MNEHPLTLIVSRDPGFASILALGIRPGKVDVECAFSFDDAVEIIHRSGPDLVIADLATRSFSSNAVIAMSDAARERGARLVILSGKPTRDTALCASLLGANGCMNKSVPPAGLVSRLQYMSRHAARNRRHGVVFDVA